MKNFFLALALAIIAPLALAQTPPGGYGPGGGSSSSSGSSAGTFSLLTFGAVDDDATDNCANGSIAALNAAVNAYAGPNTPPVAITPSSKTSGMFKLATNSNACHFEFDIPVSVYQSAGIDCAQTANNCAQLGASGLGAIANIPTYFWNGGGLWKGGTNLVNAGLEVSSFVDNAIIDHIQWFNFGATNATAGVCTNWAIQIDANVPEATISKMQWTQSDSVVRRCGFNNVGSVGGNTVLFLENVMGGGNAGGVIGNGICNSTLIREGGNFGIIRGNNLYSGSIEIRLAGLGTRVEHNILDTAGCLLGGVNAPIQYGDRASTTNVQSIAISDNNPQSPHVTFLLAKAGDTNAGSTIADTSITGNQADGGTVTTIDASNCTLSSSGLTQQPCVMGFNTRMINPVPSGTVNQNWTLLSGLAGQIPSQTGKTANLPSTLLVNAPTIAAYNINCEVVVTTQATTSSTLPQCQVLITDAFSGVAQTITITPVASATAPGCTTTPAFAANLPAGFACYGTATIVPSTVGQAINIQTINYASVGGTAMAYTLFADLVKQ